MAFWDRWRRGPKQGAANLEAGNTGSTMVALAQNLPAGPTLFGRDVELGDIANSSASVRLVTGFPGVGKSGLLATNVTRLRTSEGRSAVANPVELENRSGALQSALLGSLGLALAGFESTQSIAERWGRVFDDALERTADAKAQDLIRGAVALMNGVVRARLGDPAADALEAFEANLSMSIDEQLSRRIEAQADAGAIAAFVALAEQVSALVVEPVVLTIDRGERLSDEDLRLLLDLVEVMPAGVHLNLGHTIRGADDENRVRQILDAGNALAAPSSRLQHLRLDGLEHEAVAEWMVTVGLDPDRGDDTNVDEVMRVTAGYPLHVDLAINAISAGQRLSQLTGHDALLDMMRTNFDRGLTAEDQRAAMLLAAFSDRPDDELLMDVLEVGDQGWAVLQQRLVTARFLVATTDDDKPWFHELGRRVLWDQVLSAEMREVGSRAAVGPLLDSIASAGSARIAQCLDLARLAATVPDEVDQHSGFSAILNLNRGHLAALGSLLELTDSANPGAFVGDIVYYARQRFPTVTEDLFDSARELEGFGIAAVSSDDQDSVVVPHSISPEANLALVGRIVDELGRVPIRSLPGELLRGVLLPSCDSFHEATFGPGYANLTALARELADREWDRTTNVIERTKLPGLILNPRLGDLELAGLVNFKNEADRDLAFDELQKRSGSRVFGEVWSVDDVYKWPQLEPVQEKRFAAAAELLTGAGFDSSFAPRNVSGLASVSTFAEQLDLTVRYWELVASLATDLERAVLGLQRPRGAAFFRGQPGLIWAEIHGRRAVIDMGEWGGQNFGLEARQAFDRGLDLGPGERVTTLHYRGGATPTNPIPELITETTKMLKAFNASQRIGLRQRVPFEVETISGLILASVVRRRTDANALVEGGFFAAPDRPLGRRIFMAVRSVQDDDDAGLLRRRRGGLLSGVTKYEFATDGPDEVHIVVNESGVPMNIMDTNGFETVFGCLPDGEPIRSSSSDLIYQVSKYLCVPVSI